MKRRDVNKNFCENLPRTIIPKQYSDGDERDPEDSAAEVTTFPGFLRRTQFLLLFRSIAFCFATRRRYDVIKVILQRYTTAVNLFTGVYVNWCGQFGIMRR